MKYLLPNQCTPSIDKMDATVECLLFEAWIEKRPVGKFGSQSMEARFDHLSVFK